MNDEQQLLKEKTLQLLRSEREALALRQRYEQTLSWLHIAQSLPELVDPRLPPAALYARISRSLVTGLRLQRTMFFRHRSGELLLATDKDGAPPPRLLSTEAQALLAGAQAGVCNEPADQATTELAAAIGLHRFVWTFIRIDMPEELLLAAGFDRERAVFHAPFDDGHVAQLASLGQHIGALIRNANLVNELERDKQRLQQFNDTLEQRVAERTLELARAVATLEEKDARLASDLRQARQFQQGILPPLEGYSGIRFDAVYRPLDLVGGDIYDVCTIGARKFRVFLADVTGHGVQASLRTIVLKGEYDRVKDDCPTPDVVLDRLNRRLASAYPEAEMLSTACCLDLDLSDGVRPMLRYSCAAHPAPVRISRFGTVHEHECLGPCLAMPSAAQFPLAEVSLESGEIVLAYTDGLSDQMGTTQHCFDVHGAISGLNCRNESLRSVLDGLMTRWEQFRGAHPVDDDLTIVAAQIE